MSAKGVVLASNVSSVANTTPVTWTGGRAALCLVASSYPTTLNFQVLLPDGATYLTLNGSTLAANQMTSFDLPAGQYRLAMSGGTATALYASLVSVSYT